jgi:hypothetical protein
MRRAKSANMLDDHIALAAKASARINTAGQLRFVGLMAKTLGTGLCGKGWRSIGLDTQRASMQALRKKRSAQGGVFGREAMSCHGAIARALGTADGLASVRMTPIRDRRNGCKRGSFRIL